MLVFRSKAGKIGFNLLCALDRGNNKWGILFSGSSIRPFMVSLNEGEPIIYIIEDEEKEKKEEWEEI